ncbi:MAG TPA: metallophosphoesterase [Bryobacteraceae bacterium]|nr:metallophosphoesterase [Bryobacteraceae bacterium]
MTRRQFVSSISLVGAVPGYAFGVEPNWLEQTRRSVPVPFLEPRQRIRILQLSDLHVSAFVPFSLIHRAISMGLESKPDLICLTGDFITNAQPFDTEEYARLLRMLSQSAPTFASLGNHDGGSWAATHIGGFPDSSAVRSLLDSAGISLLHNRSEKLRIRGQAIYLGAWAIYGRSRLTRERHSRECHPGPMLRWCCFRTIPIRRS